MKKIILSFLILFLLAGAYCSMPLRATDLEDYFSDEMDMKIITNNNIESLYGVSFFERSNLIILLQCNSGAITNEYIKIINKFLRRGGTIWISDSAVAENFGFVKANFSPKEIKGKKIKTFYAQNTEYPAYACSAYPASDDRVLTNVKAVKVDCVMVGTDLYSAVGKAAQDDNFYPVLKLDNGSYACAYRAFDKGKVVFIPIVNCNDSKNKVFWDNIKLFSFDTLPAQEKEYYGCKIKLATGKILQGYIFNKEIDVFVSNDIKTYQIKDLQKIKFLHQSALDEIYFKDGKFAAGIVSAMQLEFSPDGKFKEKYEIKSIDEIEFE